jgi:hypothetical protein
MGDSYNRLRCPDELMRRLQTSPHYAVAYYWRDVLWRSGLTAAAFCGVFGKTDVKKMLTRLKRNPYLNYDFCYATGLPVFISVEPHRVKRITVENEDRNLAENTLLDLWSGKKLPEEAARTYGHHPISKHFWKELKDVAALYKDA